MQLQFEKKPISCLHTVKREIQSQEQTDEIRIGDGMPDIGSIIGAWGQVIIRSKEWRSDGMRVNGGTMIWVQYLPEEGGQPQCVESWLPFQMQWTFPPTQHDGVIMTQDFLCSVDARSTSARKMLLRTNISVMAWAMEKRETDLYLPANLPDDIQLRRETYPILLPVAAGEKSFALEESVSLPPSVPRLERLMYCHLQPEITEWKILGDKVVFRGNATLHILYLSEDGGQYSWDFDLPFTQYGELEQEYAENVQIMLLPAVTALELDRGEEKWNVKVGLVCQYRICEETMVEVVTDAYSPRRTVALSQGQLELPGILENKTQNIHAQVSFPLEGMRLTDVHLLPSSVHVRNTGAQATLELPCRFEMLYYDMDGNPHTAFQKWEETMTLPMDTGCMMETVMLPVGKPQGNLMAGNGQLNADLQLTLQTVSGNGIPMVTGFEMGELQQPDSQRPSLILVRPGEKDLWQLAKQYGSTIEEIRRANQLQEDVDAKKVLLIPVV